MLSSVVSAEPLFTVDEFGAATAKGEIRGDFDQATAFKAAKRWLNTADMESDKTEAGGYKEVEGESLTFSGGFNTQSRYNPFAGTFTENLYFTCNVKCADGVISYELSDLSILYIYAGFGVNEKRTSVGEMIEDIQEFEAIISNPNATSAEKSKAKKDIKDPKGSIASAEEEIGKRVHKALEKALKKVKK